MRKIRVRSSGDLIAGTSILGDDFEAEGLLWSRNGPCSLRRKIVD